MKSKQNIWLRYSIKAAKQGKTLRITARLVKKALYQPISLLGSTVRKSRIFKKSIGIRKILNRSKELIGTVSKTVVAFK